MSSDGSGGSVKTLRRGMLINGRLATRHERRRAAVLVRHGAAKITPIAQPAPAAGQFRPPLPKYGGPQ